MSVSGPNIGNAMLTPPFIPRLNEYYGRRAYFRGSAARSEPGGLGIIINVTDDQLTLHAIPFPELISNILETYGIKAKPSPAGLVTARLIEQMGGVQGCRVFKIAGVRSLIKKYAPDRSFERTEALTMIGDADPTTHQPRFDEYKRLYIERRERPELKPEDAFLYLLKKGERYVNHSGRRDFRKAQGPIPRRNRLPECGAPMSGRFVGGGRFLTC